MPMRVPDAVRPVILGDLCEEQFAFAAVSRTGDAARRSRVHAAVPGAMSPRFASGTSAMRMAVG